MPITFAQLQDRTKYKKLLKDELSSLKASPTVFHCFDKFKFSDGKVGPLLLIGDMARKDLFEAAKDTHAPIKARGKCAKAGEKVQFAADLGSVPLAALKLDMDNADAEEVKALGAAPAAPEAAKAAPDAAALQKDAEHRLELVKKQFDGIKGKVSDDERKTMREAWGRIDAAMEAGQYAKALAELKTAEAESMKAMQQLRDDRVGGEKAAEGKVDAGLAALKKDLVSIVTTEKEVKSLADELKSAQAKLGLAEARKGKRSQENATRLRTAADTLRKQIDTAKATLVTAQKAKEIDTESVKALAEKLAALQSTWKLADDVLEAPGKLADDPELSKAGQAIEGKVKQMGDAAKWQQDQLKNNPSGHGVGRHGAQTGIERQAQRVASDVTPDQSNREGGTAALTANWKTTIKYTENADGTRTVSEPARIVSHVIGEVGRTFATKTASMFLNPALEHEAVTRAIAIATTHCTWKDWDDHGTWKPLTSLTIVVPKPKTAAGYGLAVERADGFVKQSANDAAAAIKKFEKGTIKTIDALMAELDVQLKPDVTGVGAGLIPHARVVLTRADANSPWTDKTHFPTEDPPGWECAKGVSLAGQRVRGPGNAVSVAPAMPAG